MAATLLDTHRVAKVWGRRDLWPGFADPAPQGEPVGEVWFETPAPFSDELLVKYLFTSEKLSVQVHPDDDAARAAGHRCGKDEAWLILAAEPDSTIALGTVKPLDQEDLRSAALDGSIERLLDWKPVRAGDFFYSPAGTVHAIGAGITLIEVQQNVDLTYRLYDYGRPRELHLDEAVAVADARPFEPAPRPSGGSDGREPLADSEKFRLERWSEGTHRAALADTDTAWLIPISGTGSAGDIAWRAGQCLAISGATSITLDPGASALFAQAA